MSAYIDTDPPLHDRITEWLSPGSQIATPRETIRADEWLERERKRFSDAGRETAIHRLTIGYGKKYIKNCGQTQVYDTQHTFLCLARK